MPSLRELGELGIIRILENSFGKSKSALVGFRDDVSAFALSDGKVAVLKTDMLVGSTDVPPGMTMRQVGWKAVVANVSDLAAKGVRPLAGLVSLGLPSQMTEREIRDLATGLRESSDAYGFHLIGGDTNESEDLSVSIALFAIANRKQLVLRRGAEPGDLVAVTGDFGSTAAGLLAVLRMKKKPKQLPRPLYDAVFNPRAQLQLGLRLMASGAVTSSIDSSDGLAWSLHELASSSRVGFRIDRLPISLAARQFAERHELDAQKLALYGGEEYQLILTVRRGKLRPAMRAARGRLNFIGEVTSKSHGIRLRRDNSLVQIPRKGWEHFRQ